MPSFVGSGKITHGHIRGTWNKLSANYISYPKLGRAQGTRRNTSLSLSTGIRTVKLPLDRFIGSNKIHRANVADIHDKKLQGVHTIGLHRHAQNHRDREAHVHSFRGHVYCELLVKPLPRFLQR